MQVYYDELQIKFIFGSVPLIFAEITGCVKGLNSKNGFKLIFAGRAIHVFPTHPV